MKSTKSTKSDLLTSIVVFVVGVVIAFVTCNMIVPGIEDFTIETINIKSGSSLEEPNVEVFNYRAINPTVEVYVGEGCEAYDENGNCVNNNILNIEEGTERNGNVETPEENDNGVTN